VILLIILIGQFLAQTLTQVVARDPRRGHAKPARGSVTRRLMFGAKCIWPWCTPIGIA
jgi:hypothetical protein